MTAAHDPRHPTAAVAVLLGLSLPGCNAFSLPLPRFPLPRPSTNINGGCNGGGGGKHPRFPMWHCHDGDDSGNSDGSACNLAGLYWISAPEEDEDAHHDITDSNARRGDMAMPTETPRGGGGVATKESPAKRSDDARKSFGASINDALDSVQTVMFGPLRVAGSALSKAIPANPFKKSTDGQSDDAKLKEQQQLLTSTKVQSVSVPGSDLLPPDVVTQCAQESNLIGGTLTPETLEATAKMINRQYLQQGYVMNSVTGATLVPGRDGEEGHVELKVREVKLAHSGKGGSSPVHIGFVEKIDSEDAADDENAVSLPSQSGQTAYKTTSGRTRASKIARMVNLTPGSHFCIFPDLWSQLSVFPGSGLLGGSGKGGVKSAIFSTIHAIRPVPTSPEGNTVELDILATENKPYASLEYGVTKSLYSDQWEGELDVKHANVFGGGEVATLNVRKGANRGAKEDTGLKNWNRGVKGGPLNWRMSIKDDHLSGGGAGYDVDVFRDHVGGAKGQTAATPAKEEDSEQGGSEEPNEEDAPLRTGATMRLRLPSKAKTSFLPQSLSARLERVDPFSTNDGAQCMASMSADIGPYQHRLRSLHSAISATVSSGRRWNVGSKSGESGNTLPYGSGTVTSQHALPLNEEGSLPSAELAVRNVVSASSRNLPRHEAISLGVASRIRGYRYNYSQYPTLHEPAKAQKKEPQSPLQSFKQFVRGGDRDQFRPPIALAKSVSGTAEVRIPFERLTKQRGGGTFVMFGDWCFAQAQPTSSALLSKEEAEATSYGKPFRHSSVGIGLRQVVQGLPLKVDACITEHGSKGLFFGIGQ
ncbi:hypothetical protein ACHAXT_010334 [Thalassiosira profunda]